jgi:hypothetical protein
MVTRTGLPLAVSSCRSHFLPPPSFTMLLKPATTCSAPRRGAGAAAGANARPRTLQPAKDAPDLDASAEAMAAAGARCERGRRRRRGGRCSPLLLRARRCAALPTLSPRCVAGLRAAQ